MNLLRHEKFGRWESNHWCWAEDPDYDKTALGVAEGKREIDKQRALYVELDKTGQVSMTPEQVTNDRANSEHGRGRRYESCVRRIVEGGPQGAWDYERVENYLRTLFSQQNGFIFIESGTR